jgi:ABC-type transporter Mla subunit MlaD
METRAPFMIVGSFVLAAIVAVFGFIYWLNNAGGIGKRESYHVVFNGPVPGLLVGAAVLFNGIRVGEVTSLDLVADRPHDVYATIAVAEHTPVRADTKVTLDFQGLTGVPVVALEGGEDANAPRVGNALIAEKGAGESMTQAARNALRNVDNVLSENATPLHQAIANLSTFTDGLARNTPKLDGIVAGLERMSLKCHAGRSSPACSLPSPRQRPGFRRNASFLPRTKNPVTTLPTRSGATRCRSWCRRSCCKALRTMTSRTRRCEATRWVRAAFAS